MQSNRCHLCEWDAPSVFALKDHLLTVHPRQKNEPKKDDKDWIYNDAITDIDYKGYDWIKGDN